MKPVLLKGQERPITHILYNNDGDLLFTSSKDAFVNVWNAHTGEQLGAYVGHTGVIWSFDVTFDSKYLITGSGDNSVKIWEVQTGKLLRTIKHSAPVRCVGWGLGPGNLWFSITDSFVKQHSTINIFKREEGQSFSDATHTSYELPNHKRILDAKWGPLNETIVTADEEGNLIVYDPKTGEELKRITPHKAAISKINFDDKKILLITASKDGTAKLFDYKTLDHLKTYETGRPINCAVISPVKNYVLLAGGESSETVTTTRLDTSQFRVRFFDKIHENEIGSIMGHFGTVNTIAISPDGKSFASGAEDATVRLHFLNDNVA